MSYKKYKKIKKNWEAFSQWKGVLEMGIPSTFTEANVKLENLQTEVQIIFSQTRLTGH